VLFAIMFNDRVDTTPDAARVGAAD
jgi:hypothetical protein